MSAHATTPVRAGTTRRALVAVTWVLAWTLAWGGALALFAHRAEAAPHVPRAIHSSLPGRLDAMAVGLAR